MQKNCKKTWVSFEISQFEQDFLKKIAPEIDGERFEIPLPDLCPDERVKARTIHRNEQMLYKNISAVGSRCICIVF